MTLSKAIENLSPEIRDKFVSEEKKSIIKESITSPPNHLRPYITCLEDVQKEEVFWLWHGFLATRKLTILEGDPGEGKTFVALNIASIITNGWDFPDDNGLIKCEQVKEPGNVIYMTAEDGLSDTIKPRLELMNANQKKMFVLEGCFNEKAPEVIKAVSLKELDILRETFEELRPTLLVVDPLQAYLGTGVDMHRANEVRPVLAGIMRLAEEFNMAVIFIRHLNKSNAGKALYRGMGSIDFTAAARSVLMVGRDPVNKQNRVVIQTKSSLSQEVPAVGFRIDEKGFVWTGKSDLTVDQILSQFNEGKGGRSAIDEANEFIIGILQNGPVAANDVYQEARSAGISKSSLMRAKDKLKINCFREKDKGRNACWMWNNRYPIKMDEHLEHQIESPNLWDSE